MTTGDADTPSTFGPILTFWVEHRFLSNFSPAAVRFDGEDYPTVEHAYQAAKTVDMTLRRRIRGCATAGQAKSMTEPITPHDGWDDPYRLALMSDLLKQKFEPEPLRSRLASTAGRLLVEGNTWGDTFWGMCDGLGSNYLGSLLMTVRARILGLADPVLLVADRYSAEANLDQSVVHPDTYTFLEWARTRFVRVVADEVPTDLDPGFAVDRRVVVLSSDAARLSAELWDVGSSRRCEPFGPRRRRTLAGPARH